MAGVILIVMMIIMSMVSWWLMKEMWEWFKHGR